METQATRNTHPLMIIAAISVTLLSAAGIGAIMGWIPSSNSQHAAAPIIAEAPKAVEAAKPLEPVKTVEAAKPAPAKAKPALKAEAKTGHKTEPKAEQKPVAAQDSKPVEYTPPVQVATAPPVKQICYDCGVVESVRTIEKAGEGSGLGAVAGGVLGGVLGNQMGNGNGRTVMTVLGAVGGGLAGNKIEQNSKKTKHYEVTVRFEDGTTRVFNQETESTWRSGDKVRVNNGVLSSNG